MYNIPMRIFFGGPLTDLKNKEETKHFYVHMAEVAKNNGVLSFWAFLNGTDPIKNPDVPSAIVYETDLSELERSDVMITYIGEPTTGTGQEMEYARTHGIPVYLLYEAGKKITRMLLGSPIVKGEITFSTEEEALLKLDELIKGLKSRYDEKGTLREDPQFFEFEKDKEK
jgi:nucleoside 2-deoxyribosyltransferase